MCNLYRMTKGTQEVAAMFAVTADGAANYGAEVYPGYAGLVVAGGAARAMAWGFPLVLKGKAGQPLKPKPVTNARADKLDTAFWRDSFARRRCLIPVSQWAEPRGSAGRMMRSWYGLPDTDLFAVAGLWRASAEWADCYAMVMTDSCAQMADVHDRMPVILRREHWETWTHGGFEQALALCETWPGALTAQHTRGRWANDAAMPERPEQPELF